MAKRKDNIKVIFILLRFPTSNTKYSSCQSVMAKLFSSPDAILQQISEFLPFKDALNFFSINKRMRTIFTHTSRFLISVNCDFPPNLCGKDFTTISSSYRFMLPRIQKLVLQIFRGQDNTFVCNVFQSLPNLQVVVAGNIYFGGTIVYFS